jgi:hypothetical protein
MKLSALGEGRAVKLSAHGEDGKFCLAKSSQKPSDITVP